jgi:hypothetical protein
VRGGDDDGAGRQRIGAGVRIGGVVVFVDERLNQRLEPGDVGGVGRVGRGAGLAGEDHRSVLFRPMVISSCRSVRLLTP